jgi:hypothetical protein
MQYKISKPNGDSFQSTESKMVEVGILIADDIEYAAEWRRDKAEEFPADALRNLKAAAKLDRIGADVRRLDGSQWHWWLAGTCRRDPNRYGEILAALIRAVGFRSAAANGEQFLIEFRFLLASSEEVSTSIVKLSGSMR